MPTVPYNQEPFRTLKGAAAIRKYHVLNDKRTILAQDTQKNVAVYDVLKVFKMLSFYYFICQTDLLLTHFNLLSIHLRLLNFKIWVKLILMKKLKKDIELYTYQIGLALI